jgi:heptosyltransferase I
MYLGTLPARFGRIHAWPWHAPCQPPAERTIGPVEAPRRILLIRPSALGDVCRTVPVLVSLKRAWPEAEVDWLVHEALVDAVRTHPDLHEAIPFPRKGLGAALRRLRVAPALAWARSLRRRGYDVVIDAQGLLRSGVIARVTGAPVRVGHRTAREFAWVFYNCYERGSRDAHTVDRMLALVQALGVRPVADMRLHTPPEDRLEAESDPDLAEPYVVLAPTSRWPGKQWPAERFEGLAAGLLEHGAVRRIVVVGGPDERGQCTPLLERAARDDRVVDRVGRTSVGGLMATIERASLVVANDSAALHMAVGFDRPLVALFGPTHVGRVGPYGREADVLRHVGPDDRLDHKDPASGRALMERITPGEVLSACLSRLPAR